MAAIAGLLLASCSGATTSEGDADADREPSDSAGQADVEANGGSQTEGGEPDEGGLDEGEASLAEPNAEVLDALSLLGGRLAIGKGGALAIAEPDGSNLVWLADDADVVAAQPTWSHDGDRLAWSRASATDHDLVVFDLESGGSTLSSATGPAIYYLQWSADDETLAYLRASPLGGVEMGFAIPGVDITPIAVAAPFFVSWAPVSQTLATHVNANQVIIVPNPLGLPPGEAAEPVVAVERSGTFSTPTWIDESTILAVTPEGLVRIDVVGFESELVIEAERGVRFVMSPDRLKIAYSLADAGGSPIPVGFPTVELAQEADSGLVVLDLVTGESVTVTDKDPLSWEWSPDSEQLAWLEGEISPSSSELRWNFWDGADSIQSAIYEMSVAFERLYVPFFEQYSQSITGWSPDSTAFAFAGKVVAAGSQPEDSVWVQLVTIDSPPVRVAEGDVVTWSG